MSDNKEIVLKAFKTASKPLKAGEVADIISIEKTEVSKIIKLLQKEGRLVSPKNCYYSPS